jgi:hypothetical protein
VSLIGEAFVRIRPDDTGFRAEATKQVKRDLAGVDRSVASSNREVGRFSRGALVGTGALGGLGRAAAFASGAFIGGAGLTFALKSTVAAAEEAQAVQAQLANALEQQNISLKDNKEAIDRRTQALSQMSGFDDELITTTFINFVRRTGDVTKALHLNAIAVDVARGRNISLEASSALVTRASLGMAGSLRRVGIAAHEGASATELLDLLQRKYAGSAEAYGKTAVGAQERFKVALENTQEVIGAALLPSLTDLLTKVTDWLNDSKNQKRVQDDVNKTVDTGTGFVQGLASAYGEVKSAWDKLPDFGKSKGIVDLAGELSSGLNPELERFVANAKAIAALPTVGDKISEIFGALTGTAPDLTFFDQQTIPLLKGQATVAGKPESIAQQLARAVSAAGLTPGTSDDERALRAQNAQFQKGLDFALEQLRLKKGNLKRFSDDARTLQDEIAANESTLAGFQADRDAAAEKRRREAAERAKKAQQRILDDFKAGLRYANLGVDVDPLTIGEVNKAIAKRLKAAKDKLTGAAARREDIASVQTAIAEQRFTNDKKLIPFIENELTVAQQTAKLLKRIGASKLDQLNEALHIATLRRRIRDIRNEDAQNAFSIQDLFGEGGRQFAAYGSNVAPLNQPLSRQESGGAAVAAAQAGGKTIQIVQNFIGARDAGQAINEASNAARALRY